MNNSDGFSLLTKDLYTVTNNSRGEASYLKIEEKNGHQVLKKQNFFIGFFHSFLMKNNDEEIKSLINKHVEISNNLDRNCFVRENGEVTELFIAAHRYNQCIQNKNGSNPSSLGMRVELKDIHPANVPELSFIQTIVKEKIQIIKEDQPEIVKERRFFHLHDIRRYPGDHIDHSKEAGSIFINTQLERMLSAIGRIIEAAGRIFGCKIETFQKFHYRNKGETEEQIYSDASPIICSDYPEPTSYWLGHASLLLNVPLISSKGTRASFNVITDPVEGDLNKFLYPRQTNFARSMDRLPASHLYLLSHNHLDHFDKEAIKKLILQQPIMVVPKGDGYRYRDMGFDHVVELDWWEKQRIELIHNNETYEMKICATPARHWAGQGPCGGHESTFLGYVIEGVEGGDLYFAGDTARLSEDHINKLRDNFDIKWSFQPGGPDEMRREMKSTHQASVDALWMHFNLMVKKQYFEGMDKEKFLESVSNLKTIYMHTMTFKLGNLHLSDTDDSMKKIIHALENEMSVEGLNLKDYEKQVFDELAAFSRDFKFSNGETLALSDVGKILKESVAVPKIGSRVGLKTKFVQSSLFGEKGEKDLS